MARKIFKRCKKFLILIIPGLIFLTWVLHYFYCVPVREPEPDQSTTSKIGLDEKVLFRFFNKLGQRGTTESNFHFWLSRETDKFRNGILSLFELRAKNQEKNMKSLAPRDWISKYEGEQINIAVNSCGTSRVDEAITMLKSVMMLSQGEKLNVIAFVDKESSAVFGKNILTLKWEANRIGLDFRFELQRTWFPAQNEDKCNLWQPCATQRLFFPKLLLTYDSVLFVDADVVFLSNVSQYWNHFKKMNDKQFVSAVSNDELPGNGWYNLHSKVPYYSLRGINAGIMLMNLTRMRQFGLVHKCEAIYAEYNTSIFLADQDILNILFSKHPELVLELPCDLNFRHSHCDCEHDSFAREDCKCLAAMRDCVSVLHGNLGSFHYRDYPFLKQIFKTFKEWDIMTVPCLHLIKKLKEDYSAENIEYNP